VRIARPQAAVAWVPSRHRYALFRLIAYLRLASGADAPRGDRGRRPDTDLGANAVVLAIDRDQSSVEAYTVCVLVWLTVSAFFAAVLSSALGLPAAIAVGIPIAALTLTLFVVMTGLVVTPVLHAVGLPRGPDNIAPATTVMLIAVTLAASYLATLSTWVRIPAWLFLGALGVNGVAAIFLFLVRQRVRAAESRCVA
jgi:hypothetical protein